MNFTFENLLGAPYRGGTILCSNNEVLSPIGNRVQKVDLTGNNVQTFKVEALSQIRVLSLSPCARLLLIFDVDGRLLLVNYQRQRVLHHMKFKRPVCCARFSPNGNYIAIGVGNQLQIWKKPSLEKELTPMHLHRAFNPVSEDIIAIDWTLDSFGIAIGCRDMTTRIYTLDLVLNYKPAVLGGHKGQIMGVFFTTEKKKKQSEIAGEQKDKGIDLITIGSKGQISEWSYERTFPLLHEETLLETQLSIKKRKQHVSEEGISIEEKEDETAFVKVDKPELLEATKFQRQDWQFHNGRWIRCSFHSFDLGGRVTLTDVNFHKETGMMVASFSNGVFEIIQFPGFHCLQRLSISQERLTSICFSPKADWIAIGAARLGQLLVWDWRMETHILKQQGHYFDISSAAYSPDGSILATGADDTKLKIFSMTTGFCYVTFKEHLMPITDVQFLPNGNAVMTSSLDGTVRAFDLIRYRNFRTFTAPEPIQFSCLAVDPKGDIVAAGSQDSFQIYVWSIKTGKLLDILAGHEGPLSALNFNPVQPVLASSSWDSTVRLWDVFGTSRGSTESFLHTHDVTTFVFSPDGKHLAAACLDGSIHFWAPFEAEEEAVLEGRRDIARGRFQTDRRIATPYSTEAHFTTLAYSADGSLLFAAGKSKFICIYDIENQVLLKKIQTTKNKSLDGVLDILNSRDLTDAGALALIDDERSDQDDEEDFKGPILGVEDTFDLPGQQKKKKPIIQTRSLVLSPTGRSFAAATTEGVLIYSLDAQEAIFDPFDLADNITPQASEEALRDGKYLSALIIALRLKDGLLIQRCLLQIPLSHVEVTLKEVPEGYSTHLIEVVASSLKKCPDLELLLNWVKSCCTIFGRKLMKSQPSAMLALKQLNQVLQKFQTDLSNTIECNLNLMRYIQTSFQKRETISNSELMDIDE